MKISDSVATEFLQPNNCNNHMPDIKGTFQYVRNFDIGEALWNLTWSSFFFFFFLVFVLETMWNFLTIKYFLTTTDGNNLSYLFSKISLAHGAILRRSFDIIRGYKEIHGKNER